MFYTWLILVIVLSIPKNNCMSRDITDTALRELQKLERIVQQEIDVAHNSLQGLSNDFLLFVNNVVTKAKIDFSQKQQSVQDQIRIARIMGEVLGKNISSCINDREAILNSLPAQYTAQMNECLLNLTNQADGTIKDFDYITDVYYSKVNSYEFQLKECLGEFLCISPIMTQIQLDMIQTPLDIENDVNSARKIIDNLRLLSQACGDNKVSSYVNTCDAILMDMMGCIAELLG